jgi:hypothetical protein
VYYSMPLTIHDARVVWATLRWATAETWDTADDWP